MPTATKVSVNGRSVTVTVDDPDLPLLYVLRNQLHFHGPRFGCCLGGQIINPDGVRNQIEGNVVQTVSRSLKEAVTFDRSAVTSLDWDSCPILTFPEIPEVVMDLIDRPDEPPWGSGEPSAAIVPAAIANAVFDAVGARLRSVPFIPAKVKAAIDAA